jgi:hypothetical protein
VGLTVLLRVALPYLIPWAIGWGAMRQAGLSAHLENADLWLLRGAIAFEGLTVAQGDDPPLDGQTPDPDSALLALDRLYLDVAWLDLFRGMLRVTEIELERPRVSVQRLADGRIDPLGQGPGPSGQREEPAQGSSRRSATAKGRRRQAGRCSWTASRPGAGSDLDKRWGGLAALTT